MNKQQNLIYFVTGNNNKFIEVSEIFQKEPINFILKQSKIEPLEIQADTLKEVALFKLNSVRDKIDESIFVEDAGFFVDIPLNGFPGVYSSYIHKTIGNEGILKLITNFKKTKVYFMAVIALYFKPLDRTLVFEGIVNGKLAENIRGKGGFGFDPIFIPDVIPDSTFAEISIDEKNKISHRGQALKKLIDFFKKNS